MTPEELDTIEARANAATPGPWTIVDRHNDCSIYGGCAGGRIDVCKIQPWMTHEEPNAAFIAAARKDVPALIAEVRRLQEENEKLSNNRDGWHQTACDGAQTIAELENRIQRLEAQAAALLKRLQIATVLADCVVSDYENGEYEELLKVSNRKVWDALAAWRKAKGE